MAATSSSEDQSIMLEVTTPTSSDVLCGTGNAMAKHPGKKIFSLIVSKYVEQYVGTDSKKQKIKISKAALDELTSSGVRFLKKHPVYQHWWYVASEKVGRDKIGHFLREKSSNVISGSDNDRRRQRLAVANRPQSPVRPNTPLFSFLRDRASSKNFQQKESISSVWSKLEDIQDSAFLPAQEGRARTNQVSSNAPNRSPLPSFFPKEIPTPLFVSSVDHGMEASTPPSLKNEPNKKVQKADQRCRQENRPVLSLAPELWKQKCESAKYDHSTSQETLRSIGSFSSASCSEIPRGIDLISSRFSWRSTTMQDGW